jgi:uncharacterized protein YceK
MKIFSRSVTAVSWALLACAVVLVSGCGSLPVDAETEKGRFEVEAATVLIIQESSDPARRAAEVVETIDRLQNLLTHERTTIGELRFALLKRVAERDLTAGELLLAKRVVDKIAARIEAQVGAGYLSPEAVVSVDAVLGWAEEAAALYVAK